MKYGIPNRVRSALASQPAGQPHPSADLLNGYAEHLLTPGEQKSVTAHLANCAECREIVFLASEAREEESVVTVPTTAARRWRWMSWAAPATAVVVVASVMVLEYPRRRAQSGQVLDTTPAQAPAQQPSQNNKTAAEPASPSTTRAVPELSAQGPVAQLQMPARTEQPKGEAIGGLASMPAETARVDRDAERKREAQSAPALPQLAMAPIQGRQLSDQQVATLKAAPKAAVPATQAFGGDARNAMPAPAPAQRVAKEQRSTTYALANVTPAVTTADAIAHDKNFADEKKDASTISEKSYVELSQVQRGSIPGAGVRWRITPDGAVEWSSQPEVWNRALTGQPLKIRVLASVGSDMWAGGNGGILFHSTDKGATWYRVDLGEGSGVGGTTYAKARRSTAIESAIVEINFSDVAHGEIRTERGELWVTGDRGQSWTRKTK